MSGYGLTLSWHTGLALLRHLTHLFAVANIASYSREMFESLHVAAVSPQHKMTLSVEFNSSLTVKSSLSP